MEKYVKLVGVVIFGLIMSACSSTYNIKSEKGKTLNQVPKWFMAEYSEKKACDTKTFGKGKDKMCIFGVGTAVSPDLELSIEKAKLIAKAEMADIIRGEMNKQTKTFITELGQTETKTIVTEVESTLINIIKNTPVRGYEIFEQDVTMTKNGYYRSWVGLRLPMGEFNKLYNYNVSQAVDAYNIKLEADKRYKELMNNESTNNSIQ